MSNRFLMSVRSENRENEKKEKNSRKQIIHALRSTSERLFIEPSHRFEKHRHWILVTHDHLRKKQQKRVMPEKDWVITLTIMACTVNDCSEILRKSTHLFVCNLLPCGAIQYLFWVLLMTKDKREHALNLCSTWVMDGLGISKAHPLLSFLSIGDARIGDKYSAENDES